VITATTGVVCIVFIENMAEAGLTLLGNARVSGSSRVGFNVPPNTLSLSSYTVLLQITAHNYYSFC